MTTDNNRYFGGLTSNQSENLIERQRYSSFIEEKKTELGIEFLDTINDKKLYGFLDRDFYMVNPNHEINSFGDYAGQIVGLNYVVSCFNDFRDFYLDVVSRSDLTVPTALEGLVVKKSFIDLEDRYRDYERLVSQVMIDPFINGRFTGPVMSFQSFVEALNEIIFDDNKRQYKITKTGYILSRYVSAFETGLYIDLAPELDPSVDQPKVDLILDPGFKCYGQTANDYGFYVDQNCPWRLVLNLNSEKAQASILNEDFTRPFYSFYKETYLIRTGLDDYWNLKAFYKKLYIKYNQLLGIQAITRSALESIPEELWIETYTLNRMRENGLLKAQDYFSSDQDPSPSKRKYQNILTSALEKYNILLQQGIRALTHNSGVILYIEDVCAEIMKEKLAKNNGNTSNP
tara:strand:- start:1097 stop:2302 length:1206 start_codon:yes stop_codon:yes gene_type:complete